MLKFVYDIDSKLRFKNLISRLHEIFLQRAINLNMKLDHNLIKDFNGCTDLILYDYLWSNIRTMAPTILQSVSDRAKQYVS